VRAQSQPRPGQDVSVDSDQVSRLAMEAARGDEVAWEALVDGFSGFVWSVTRAYGLSSDDAADVFQTVWLRLAEHLGRIKSPEHLGAWLATTTRHESLRVVRVGAKVVPTNNPALLDVTTADESPEQAVVNSDQALIDSLRARRLWQAVGELSARCQKLLRVLVASPPPSCTDIAVALGMPVGSIGPTRARCLRQLRRRLADWVSEST
jgi:RNA polymerase sigma factor (sigma-70 family)